MAGYDILKKRLTYMAGGNEPTQENINTQNKLSSMRASLTNAEQVEHVEIGTVIEGEFYYGDRLDCLINPDKLSMTYDQKEISIDPTKSLLYEGNIVRWFRNEATNWWAANYYDWIVIMINREEKAYTRAKIRRCNYDLNVDGHKYGIALVGPEETSIVWNSKHSIEFNDLNYTCFFYVTKDEITNKFFKRFQKLKFDNHNWQVAAVDRYSSDGIIKVFIDEYYDDYDTNLQPPLEDIYEEDLEAPAPYIEGPTIIYPYDIGIKYIIYGIDNTGIFKVDDKDDCKVKITSINDRECYLEVLVGKAQKKPITLMYLVDGQDPITLEIKIDSL